MRVAVLDAREHVFEELRPLLQQRRHHRIRRLIGSRRERERAKGDRISTAPGELPVERVTERAPDRVAETVATGEVVQALIAGGGPELERVDLFDRYAGEPIPDGSISLAFTLTFRAHDRTLTGDEVAMMRSAAVSEAISRCGATLRG